MKSEVDLVFIDKSKNENIRLLLPIYNEITEEYYIDPLLAKSKIVFSNQEIDIYEVDKTALNQYVIQSDISSKTSNL